MSLTLTEPGTTTTPTTTDDPGSATHIVHVPRHLTGMSPQAYVMQCRIEGTPVAALCGHTWVPERDPAKYPICSKCLAEFQNDPKGHGDRDTPPEA